MKRSETEINTKPKSHVGSHGRMIIKEGKGKGREGKGREGKGRRGGEGRGKENMVTMTSWFQKERDKRVMTSFRES